MKTDKPLLYVMFVLLIAAAGGLYYVEWVEIENDSGYSSEALRNPYLAAEKFLEKYGVESQTVNSVNLFRELPPIDEALIFASSRRGMSAGKISELIEWVEAGGVLVVLAKNIWDEDQGSSGDGLLDELQIGLSGNDGDYDPMRMFNRLNATIGQAKTLCLRDESITTVLLEDQEIEVAASRVNTLFYQGDSEISYADNEFGTQILQLEKGLGVVVAMTSFDLWNNYEIGCFDNAFLLQYLTDNTTKAWWLFHIQMPSLIELVWANYAYSVMLSVALLLLWVWWSGFRSTEIVVSGKRSRRELMEHVRGTAKFLWQQKRADHLLRAMREEILVGDKQLSIRLAGLAERSGLSEDRIAWAMGSRVRHHTDDFVQAVKILQKLREVQ